MAQLMSGRVTKAELLQVVSGVSWPDQTIIMAFTPITCRFDWYKQDNQFLQATEQGRIFAPHGELRWRLLGNSVGIVFLGDSGGPSLLTDASAQLAGLTPRQRKILLWGVRTDTKGEWLEQQVPQRFEYPISGTQFARGRVALVVEEWADAVGIPQFSRYHSVLEVKGEA